MLGNRAATNYLELPTFSERFFLFIVILSFLFFVLGRSSVSNTMAPLAGDAGIARGDVCFSNSELLNPTSDYLKVVSPPGSYE